MDYPGIIPQEKALYEEFLRLKNVQKEDPGQRRLREALQHSNATLDVFRRVDDAYTVSFFVDGTCHTTTVSASNLSVVSAKFCLSGEDHKFDLQSIVGVLKEARRDRTVVFD